MLQAVSECPRHHEAGITKEISNLFGQLLLIDFIQIIKFFKRQLLTVILLEYGVVEEVMIVLTTFITLGHRHRWA